MFWKNNDVIWKPRRSKGGVYYPAPHNTDGELWKEDGIQVILSSPRFEGENAEAECEAFCKEWSKLDHKYKG